MPLERPTLPQLVSRVETDLEVNIPDADSRLRFSVFNALAVAMAGLSNGQYGYVDFNLLQWFPDTATGSQLDRIGGGIWGIPRKAASPSAGTATITGSVGGVVAVGTQWRRSDGALFSVTDELTLTSGTDAVALQADEAGAGGNTGTATVLTLVNPLIGINPAATVISLTGGADDELDIPYRRRILDRIQDGPGEGRVSDYRRIVLQFPGVTRVFVRDQSEYGGNSVSIRFCMDDLYPDDGIPSPADVANVLAYLREDSRKVVGAEPIVQAPIAVSLNFDIDLLPNDEAVREAIRVALKELIRREAIPAGTLPISHIREAISTAAGEQDHVLISPSANVTVGAGQLTVPGTYSFSMFS